MSRRGTGGLQAAVRSRLDCDAWRPGTGRLAQGPECGAELSGEQLWLLPRGEVVAPVNFVEVDEVGVGALGPAARGLEDLVGEDADGGRDRHALDVEEPDRVLPVQPGGGNPRVRQPGER